VGSRSLGQRARERSTASLNAAGVLFTSPLASVMYSGTGSVVAIDAPPCSFLICASLASRAASRVLKVAAFLVKAAASPGSALPSAVAMSSTTLATVGKSYQTCSLSSPPLGAVLPETSTALITCAEELLLSMRSTKSSYPPPFSTTTFALDSANWFWVLAS
jgi:hypothetical protein